MTSNKQSYLSERSPLALVPKLSRFGLNVIASTVRGLDSR